MGSEVSLNDPRQGYNVKKKKLSVSGTKFKFFCVHFGICFLIFLRTIQYNTAFSHSFLLLPVSPSKPLPQGNTEQLTNFSKLTDHPPGRESSIVG